MNTDWKDCRNLLCIRSGNIGDLLMSSPAIRALKVSFNSHITVLTSSEATGITPFIPGIDEVITYDLPWVKTEKPIMPDMVYDIVKELKARNFDGAIILTGYSQSTLPAAMLTWLAGIPLRLAYCRENPYELLSHWLPDKEPYSLIKHQVRRDLDLVATIGAYIPDNKLIINISDMARESLGMKLKQAGVDLQKPWFILHAGVREPKREYPFDSWVSIASAILLETDYQVLFTGSKTEKELTDHLQHSTGRGSFSLGGLLNLEEFIALVDSSALGISVNTGTVHIAAARDTPLIVLYALTNPQHAPWKAIGELLPFSISEEAQSKNEIISFVNEHYFSKAIKKPLPSKIVSTALDIINGEKHLIAEMPFQ